MGGTTSIHVFLKEEADVIWEDYVQASDGRMLLASMVSQDLAA